MTENQLAIVNTIVVGNKEQTISGRTLHKALEIKENYDDWFEQIADYGFDSPEDYVMSEIVWDENQNNYGFDHALSLSMAKQICIVQESEFGREVRRHFIDIENKMNDPEEVFKRALEMANAYLDGIKYENSERKING